MRARRFYRVLVAGCVGLASGACQQSERQRARAAEFLDQRELTLPDGATNVAFAENDLLRSIAYFIRLELSAAAAPAFQSTLWCTPVSEPSSGRAPPSAAPWFTDGELVLVQRCDTNGPYDGRYHLEVVVGRTPAGRMRFLLAFSD